MRTVDKCNYGSTNLCISNSPKLMIYSKKKNKNKNEKFTPTQTTNLSYNKQYLSAFTRAIEYSVHFMAIPKLTIRSLNVK